jgi:hypothetical protein
MHVLFKIFTNIGRIGSKITHFPKKIAENVIVPVKSQWGGTKIAIFSKNRGFLESYE